jgi:hypothetical protein
MMDRESDKFLRKAVVFIPILSFIVGWGSGVITTYLVFKEHDRRISLIELNQEKHDHRLGALEARQSAVLTILEQNFKIHIQ